MVMLTFSARADVVQHRGVRVRRIDAKATEEGANVQQEGEEEDVDEEEMEAIQESSGARMMVEELMLLAGEVAGKFAQERALPIPFRVQRRPLVRPHLPKACDFVSSLASSHTSAATQDDSKFFDYLERGKEKKAVVKSWKALADMPAMEYSSAAAPHFSLALDCYAQVTLTHALLLLVGGCVGTNGQEPG
jgi:exoribonuclease R